MIRPVTVPRSSGTALWRVLGLALAWLALLPLGPAPSQAQAPTTAAAEVQAEAQTPPPLRVGATLLNMPWEFYNAAGDIIGFEADLVRAIGDQLGRPVEITNLRFGELFGAVQEGRVDIAISSLSITPERLKGFDFTQPYYRTTQAVAVMRRSPIRSLGDLKDRRVSVIAQTTSDQWVSANRAQYRIGDVRHVRTLDEGLAALSRREVDAHIGDMPALLYRLLGRNDLAVVARLGTEESYGLMLAKGSPLTEPVNAIVSRLKMDGTLARIHQTWFGSPPEPGSPVTQVLPRP
ncbi:ABC transporter substrate-binding protein [Ancylobacter sp. WKF20]|uniref:substrate-binding periplasmic protein n=1 Tax=Ancylobacter sp. WKF20 TaxID=3039801 RepID=UPI002434571F|nr:ABC transporter substrate-binding protein [Ancylobacter sp. WKF20]WGD28762.1 ABC transporter substrate-binding protein [Ancylobacter sp. WKF20]